MKKAKRYFWFGLLIVTSLISIPSFLILKNPILLQTFESLFESLFHSGNPDWNSYTSPDGSISFESPFKISWTSKESIKNGKGFQSLYGISQPNRSEFTFGVEIHRFIGIEDPPNPKYFLDGLYEGLKSYSDFHWESKPVTCSGLPATLALYSFKSTGFNNHMAFFLLDQKRESFYISMGYQGDNTSPKADWVKRIIESIKINTIHP